MVVSQTYRTYKIASYVYFYGHTKSENAYILILDNDALKRYPEIRTFEEKQFGEFISKADSVKIGFSQGIFGFENFENKELLFTEKSANP
ncbi:MAG: hypothetical protein IPP71_08690 [Bacteroidetes bacterium]|nr:hypothetical protein [Bacteroidota bacterium]